MIHSQVYGYFKECLPEREKEVKEYFPNGRNSIRVRQNDGQEFIFSVTAPKVWKEKGNMDEMIRYIFGSLRCSETAMSVIAKTLRKQKSFNRTVTLFAMATTAHLAIQSIEISNLSNEVKSLKAEIKELKNTEGD